MQQASPDSSCSSSISRSMLEGLAIIFPAEVVWKVYVLLQKPPASKYNVASIKTTPREVDTSTSSKKFNLLAK